MTEQERIFRVLAHDLERAERVPQVAFTHAARAFLATLLRACDVTDAVPASMSVSVDGNVSVESESRGRVRVGTWNALAIREAERKELHRLHEGADGRDRSLIQARLDELDAEESAEVERERAALFEVLDSPSDLKGPTYNGRTPADILAAKRAHDNEGHNSLAMWRRLQMSSPRDLVRARHALGLVPWPEE